MRTLLTILIALGVICIWDVNYNHGALTDGTRSMLRDIGHSIP
ncbi:hypothetical protein SAMN05444169_2491 [Bradyrhizobium erythrophlei]|uniref:Uncharacterized protein n=1 Tax=Bradyrhizobium erythrophlei TaxID=1437360 RepID=A0A1M5JW38_9BRAD|nr:hypothetical protein SAMN05444169_2491 [Bradyrhizobium erythrophlei]